MKTLLLFGLVLLAGFSTGHAQLQVSEALPLPDEVRKKMESSIRAACPEVTLEMKDQTFIAKYKSGVVAGEGEERPAPRGFVLTVQFVKGQYDGKIAIFPRTVREPTYKMWLNKAETDDGQHYYWIRFRYGHGIAPQLRKAIIAALPKKNRPKETATLSTEVKEARAAYTHFQEFLKDCQNDEIRCLYSPRATPLVGNLMTIHLKTGSVQTVRDVYNLASQNFQTRELTAEQTKTLRSLMTKFDGLEEHELHLITSGDHVWIAFNENDDVRMRTYSLQQLPAFVQQIYEIAGGELK